MHKSKNGAATLGFHLCGYAYVFLQFGVTSESHGVSC